MKKTIICPLLALILLISSCVKPSADLLKPTTSNTLIVPAGFTWSSSKAVSLTVKILDSGLNKQLQFITIYDGNPLTGANVMAKGSVSAAAAFKCNLVILNNLRQLYISKISADNNKTITPISINGVNVIANLDQ